MGSPRKPAGRRQNHRTKDKVVEVVSGRDVPAPPPDTLVVTRKAWETFWNDELASLVKPADHQALRRLFTLYDQRERLQRILRKEPFTTGSTGQIVEHPAAKTIASVDNRILALEDRFGITPMGRLKLGVTFGAAAKSLEDLNRAFDDDEDQEDEDPRRLAVVDTTARDA